MSNGMEVLSADVPAIADDTLLQVAERAEKRIEAVNKIKLLALKVTNAHDWTNQGGKPYLQASGGEKVARLFGISWRISEPVYESEEGGHYSYTYTGTFSLSGATIEAVGTRSSKDGFFKKYGDNRETLPPSEIDKGDVKKAAFTNLIGNGITRLLGIRNLTWEDLEAAGIKKENVGKVDYKKSGKQTDGDIKSEEAQTVIITVTDVRMKTGEKNGKKWTSYTVKNGGSEYKTFSETFAKLAKEAMTDKVQVEITYKAGQYGNDIESLKKVEREPGEEG
jgi:hypothetical protein